VKVADFGMSRDLCDFNNQLYESTAKSAKLPVKWMSPESLQYRQYSSKSDVVSLLNMYTRRIVIFHGHMIKFSYMHIALAFQLLCIISVL